MFNALIRANNLSGGPPITRAGRIVTSDSPPNTSTPAPNAADIGGQDQMLAEVVIPSTRLVDYLC